MDGKIHLARPVRQSGASAIEFGLVMPLLLGLTYAIFVYSYVFVIYESINYAAQQGAESAVAVDPLSTDYLATVQSHAQVIAAGTLSWLPADTLQAAVGGPSGSLILVQTCSPSGGGAPYCPVAATGGTPIVVTITFPVTQFFPSITLPGLGTVPPLPASIVGVGVTLLSGNFS